jgi:tRNA modification GTPase
MPTYVACLTPPGAAAIATVGLYGPDAWRLVQPLFRPRHPQSAIRKPHFLLGRLGDDFADEVVLTVDEEQPTPRVEIHCHGGVTVVRWLLDLLRNRGAVEVSWQSWLRLTTPSPLQAEAAIALAQARTLRTANILLDQYHGALERALRDAVTTLQQGHPAAAAQQLDAVLAYLALGRHLIQPWRVVLAGAPNVGKSSLINTLLGFQRAITSPVPGTTRDVVTALTAFDGWPVELLDTAGVHEAATGLEAAGIARAQETWTTADLCLWILETGQSPALPPEALPCPFLPVLNKIDLPFTWSLDELPWPAQQILCVSAQTGEGIADLIQRIVNHLIPQPPGPGAAVPFTAALGESLRAAREALERGAQVQALALLDGLLRAKPENPPDSPDA